MTDRILLASAGLLAALSCIFSSVKQFQMLQQNSYFPSRYFKWIKSSYTLELSFDTMLFCLSSVIYLSGRYILLAALFLAAAVLRGLTAVRCAKNSVKKLAVTPRIRRLFAACILILALPAVLSSVFFGRMPGEVCFVILNMISCISPLAVFAAWLVTKPVESAVSAYYINDAKRILKEHRELTVIGVTGSYGKTTTKFILNRMLSEKFNTVCTPQSFNTPMGVVRTVRTLIRPQTSVFVCEMGAKNRGDIKEICDIVSPKVGIITSVGEQHLDTFKSVDNVFSAKFELCDCVSENGGKTYVNADSPEISKRLDRPNPNIIPYGDGTEFRAENITCTNGGTAFDLILKDERIAVTTTLLGMHSVSDIVGAAAAAYGLGVSAQDIKIAAASLKPAEHRLELKPFKNGSLLIDDAYNSNPEGCLEAVKVLGRFEGKRKVIITPGLVELGKREYDCNYALGVQAAKYCDEIILVGKTQSRPVRDGAESQGFDISRLHTVSSFAEAMSVYAPTADENSVLLIENDLPDNYLN